MLPRLVMVLVGFGMACSDRGSHPAVIDAAADASGGEPEDASGVTAFEVRVVDGNDTGITGGTLCVVGQSDCEATNGNGDATVSVLGDPGDLKLGFSAAATDHLTTVGLGRIYVQLDVDVHTVPASLRLLTDAEATDLFGAGGFTYPASSTGYVRATIVDGKTTGILQGSTVTLDGSSAAPVYLDANGRPDLALAAVGPGGGVLFGNVPAGPFSLTVHYPNKSCGMQQLGWEASGAASSTLSATSGVVVAGALTDRITIACYDAS